MSTPEDLPDRPMPPTPDEMFEGEVIVAYVERFGPDASCHLFLPDGQLERLIERMREALRQGRPIPKDELPHDGIPPQGALF